MAYLSDTSFVPELAEFARGVEFLYHESTYLERHAELAKKTGHSTAGEAASLARLSGAKRLVLGHFSQRYARLDDFASEASAQVAVPVAVGVSGMNPLTAFADQ
jgi:ribonuclease Z